MVVVLVVALAEVVVVWWSLVDLCWLGRSMVCSTSLTCFNNESTIRVCPDPPLDALLLLLPVALPEVRSASLGASVVSFVFKNSKKIRINDSTFKGTPWSVVVAAVLVVAAVVAVVVVVVLNRTFACSRCTSLRNMSLLIHFEKTLNIFNRTRSN